MCCDSCFLAGPKMGGGQILILFIFLGSSARRQCLAVLCFLGEPRPRILQPSPAPPQCVVEVGNMPGITEQKNMILRAKREAEWLASSLHGEMHFCK